MDNRHSAARTVITSKLLTAQLDGLMAAWEHTISSGQAASLGSEGQAPSRDPAEVLAELERELGALERETAELRAQADDEHRLATDWEQRAMISVGDGRDELARDALHHHAEHRNAAEALTAEVGATEQVAGAYRNAITAIRAVLQPAAR